MCNNMIETIESQVQVVGDSLFFKLSRPIALQIARENMTTMSPYNGLRLQHCYLPGC